MNKLRVRIPFVGFVFTLLAFIATLVALSMYLYLYDKAQYDINWWTVLYSALPALFLALILVNSIFLGDDPFFMIVFYIATPFMLIYGALSMLQPCISEIAFVLGSPDLAMGDNAIRVFISEYSINTTIWYAVASVLSIIGAFTPNVFMRKDERRNAYVKKAINTLIGYNNKANKMIAEIRLDVNADPIPDKPEDSKNISLNEDTVVNAGYALTLAARLDGTAKAAGQAAGRSAVAGPVVDAIGILAIKAQKICRPFQSWIDSLSAAEQTESESEPQPVGEGGV